LEEHSIFSLINVHLCKSLDYPPQLPKTHPLQSTPLEDKAVLHTETEIFHIEKNSPCSAPGLKNISSFSIGSVSVAEKDHYQEVTFLLQRLKRMKPQHQQNC